MKIVEWAIKTPKQISNIRESWKYLNELLLILREKAKAWVALIELEFVAEHFIQQHHLKWAFKWYDWYPTNLCLSVNDCVVHGIPNDYILKNGDLLKIDAWVIYEKWYSDSAISVLIWWELSNPLAYELITVTKNALDRWIATIQPWKAMYDYWNTVATTVRDAGFKVLKDLTWHGCGSAVHERPYVFNYGHPDMKKQFFNPWMVLCFEPITAVMSDDFYMEYWDEWMYTQHWDLWCQWEYMLLITENWYEMMSWITEWE